MLGQAKDITMRHEEKYICSEAYLKILESRLNGFLQPDLNQDDNGYEVRSLYFDTALDRLYEEGIEGLESRNKYRIRIYNGNSDVIKLEKKTSIRNLKKKSTTLLEKRLVDYLLANNGMEEYVDSKKDALQDEFMLLQKTALLRPKVVVKYNRKAFVSDIGNIRITLDRNIRATESIKEFFSSDSICHPILPADIHLLEVKWDGILPGYVSKLINFESLERTAFSKYVLSMETIKNNGRARETYEL